METKKIRSKLKPDPDFVPCPSQIDDELYPNGIFEFNITRIIEDILNDKLFVEEMDINIEKWFKMHLIGRVNENHLPTVDINKPIIIAEISPAMYEVIDGNHRIEKARREKKTTIQALIISSEKLLPYFTEKNSYLSYINYWNDKLDYYNTYGPYTNI